MQESTLQIHDRSSLPLFCKPLFALMAQSLGAIYCVKYRPATLLKKRLWQRCFPVNFAKFLTAPFLQNSSGRLHLNLVIILMVHFGQSFHCVKSVQIRSFSGPHFPVFGLNTESYSVNLRIQYKYRKMRTR